MSKRYTIAFVPGGDESQTTFVDTRDVIDAEAQLKEMGFTRSDGDWHRGDLYASILSG